MSREDKIFKLRLDDIQPSESNKDIYNPTSQERIKKLANDIKRNGLLEPIVVTDDHIILSGHTRYKALKHLGRTFVKVRYACIDSNHPDFLKLLVSFNDQREKTTSEKMNEIQLDIDPETYIRKVREKRQQDPNGLKKVNGNLKINRDISDHYRHLVKAVKDIALHGHPMALRGIHYKLLNNPPIRSTHGDGYMYKNDKASYQLLSDVTTKMRVNGIIPYQKIVDEKRKYIQYHRDDNMTSFVDTEQSDFLIGYDRDLLQSQPRYVAIVCEKETLKRVISRANSQYNLPVIYCQGNSSITIRAELVRRAADRPITLLFLTDLDPDGLKIQDTFVGSLQRDFGIDDLKAFRVALKEDHIDEYNLFSNQIIKKTSTAYKEFIKNTNVDNAYELDALDQDDMQELIEDAITSVIDMDRFNEQVKIYRQEVKEIQKRRKLAMESIIL